MMIMMMIVIIEIVSDSSWKGTDYE